MSSASHVNPQPASISISRHHPTQLSICQAIRMSLLDQAQTTYVPSSTIVTSHVNVLNAALNSC